MLNMPMQIFPKHLITATRLIMRFAMCEIYAVIQIELNIFLVCAKHQTVVELR